MNNCVFVIQYIVLKLQSLTLTKTMGRRQQAENQGSPKHRFQVIAVGVLRHKEATRNKLAKL